MRRAEQLHEEILAQMDLSKEASDEELLELIHSNPVDRHGRANGHCPQHVRRTGKSR